MTGGNDNPWPEAETEELKSLWALGNSASMIGIKMKRTRNAVIGKVTRLNLPKRRSTVKQVPKNGFRPPASRPGHRQTNYNFAFNRVAKEPQPPMIEAPPPPALADIIPVNGNGITILDLHKEVCHAVVYQPDYRSNEMTRYCGHGVYWGRYCEGHYVAFHQPLRPR